MINALVGPAPGLDGRAEGQPARHRTGFPSASPVEPIRPLVPPTGRAWPGDLDRTHHGFRAASFAGRAVQATLTVMQ